MFSQVLKMDGVREEGRRGRARIRTEIEQEQR